VTAVALLDRAIVAMLIAFAVVGGSALTVLAAHGTVPDWLLPAGVAIAVVVAMRRCIAWPPVSPGRPVEWLLALAIVLACASSIGYGALATQSRHWDGACVWDVKAYWLTQTPSLQQPFFCDGAVYSHSRDYPLLQPLLIALGERLLGGGRVLFPLLFLLQTGLVGVAALRAGRRGRTACLVAVACAVTPWTVGTNAGSFDSGYGDAFLGCCVTAVAAGLLLVDRTLLLLGTFLLMLVKPEGLPYGGVLVLLLWLRGETALLRAAAVGWFASAMLWLPLQHDLHVAGQSAVWWPVAGGVLALALLLLGSDALLHRRGARLRTRAILAAVVAPLCVLAPPLLMQGFGDATASMGSFLQVPGRALARLSWLPAVVGGSAQFGLLRGGFGLTFLLPIVALLVARWRDGALPAPRVCWFVLLAAPLLLVPFLLSPIDDLAHHLRSRLPRLFVHWVGPMWILTGAALCGRDRQVFSPSTAPGAATARAS
jgi:hypothetical protein